MRRVLRRVSFLCFAALLLSAPASASSRRTLDRPNRTQIAAARVPIRDSIFHATPAPSGFWGGVYTTKTNEQVTIYASNAYALDDAANQRWADFVASLVHGPEISRVTIYMAPPAQVATMCGGADILGCYEDGSIVAPGEDTPLVSAESVVAHEYGHEIAANRSNAPWPALAWGTKRWASYEQVCRRARARELFPGAESPLLYLFNPGEAFAESYRLLNERRAGKPETPWLVVDSSLIPDARGLALIEQDVLQPWQRDHTVQLRGRFAARGRSVRTFKVGTPLDGTFSLSVDATAKVRVDALAGRKRIARAAPATSATLCGPRTLTLRVTRLAGDGPFIVAVSLP